MAQPQPTAAMSLETVVGKWPYLIPAFGLYLSRELLIRHQPCLTTAFQIII